MTDAAVLLRALTEPRPDDAALLPGLDASGLTDVELGSLVPAAYQGNRRGHPATVIAHTVQDEMRARQPRFTPAAVRALFDALVAELPHRDWADLALGVGALFRCTGEPPDVAAPARTLVRALLDRDRLGEPFALLAAAARAGQTAAVRARLTVTGPIAVDEAAVLDALAPDDLLALAEIEDAGGYARPAPHPDAWPRLAALPAVAAFARRALDAAAARVAALHAGDLPYRADKLFTADEVAALGRAARAALLRDEPWLRGLLDGLLTGVAVAPTSAKTLPSQALLYEFARAGQEFPTPELVAALRAARAATRHAGVPKQLGRNLVRVEAALAARADVALRMPDHGFAPDGTLRRTLGDHQAVITAADTATLTFHSARGPLRGVPAAVRRAHPDAVRELRDLTARVGVQLATLTRALEGGFAAVHPYAEWRSGLIDHPVAGAVARRLIWDVDGHTILPVRDALPDAPAGAPVRLWHPARATAADVAAWRDALADLEIHQPFRQAYRETYRLSPAEDGGAVRSHRFAAHLVHYRALYALFRSRGWTSGRLGPWDGGDADDAARLLGAGEWRATLAHTLADPSADLAATGAVTFARRVDGTWRDAPLADVPAVLFSEAMRDVDLFTARTSVAPDPDAAAAPWWTRAEFGALTATAETRHAALARVLPRTPLADRCTPRARFLDVAGDLRTYRIHLGSGSVLRSPDDTHLDLTDVRLPAPPPVALPFADDRLTAILATAALLAADAAIDDPALLARLDTPADTPRAAPA